MKLFSLCIILLLLVSSGAWADGDGSKQRKILRTSQMVLDEIQKSPDQNIPMTLISKAKAIIIFPTMFKAGFFVGARYGNGIASVRSSELGEWGPPAFFYTTGGSLGFQFGAEAVDLVLLVMSQRGIEGLLNEKFTLGGDIAISAGPVGRHAEASADVLMQGEIYSYSRSKGIFTGISLKGTIIASDSDANLAYYGHPYTSKEILLTGQVRKVPESGKQFIKIFNHLAPPSIAGKK